MESSIDESFEFCCRLTRRTAGNFYFSFLTLPRPKRDAMCVIYAWMRQLDDLADDITSPAQAREAIDRWRAQTQLALESSKGAESAATETVTLLWPAFEQTVRQYRISPGHFDEIAKGALMDQEITRYENFEDLYQYCHRVASVVGLVCLGVFEYKNSRAEQMAEWLGIAFQLTNILRDLREDAERSRIYIPLADLRHHGVLERDILEARWSENVRRLLEAFAERAEEYYVRAQPVVELVSREAQPTLRIMTEIYHGILVAVRRMDYRVFENRARLPAWKKWAIVAKHRLSLT